MTIKFVNTRNPEMVASFSESRRIIPGNYNVNIGGTLTVEPGDTGEITGWTGRRVVTFTHTDTMIEVDIPGLRPIRITGYEKSEHSLRKFLQAKSIQGYQGVGILFSKPKNT